MLYAVDPRFRTVLETLRIEAGLSQRQLASRAHLSPGYVSQVRSGSRNPSRQVAQALDDALGADGQLVALVGYGVSPDDHDRLASAAARPRHAGAGSVASLARVLASTRALDDDMGSAYVIASATAQVGMVTAMVRELAGPARPQLLTVAAQWAQFVGWLHVSTGRWSGARSWLATGVEWATEVGDQEIGATLVSYQSHLAWLTGQVAPAIGLAAAAARNTDIYPGQRAYDLYASARGQAFIGQTAEARQLLAQADDTAARVPAWDRPVPTWHYYRAPWQWSAERGMVLLHMATSDPRHAPAAVDELRAGVDSIPAEWAGADWAGEYVTQLAGAYVRAGAFDMARAELDRARAIAHQTGSTRVLRLVAAGESRLRGSTPP